MQNHVYKLVWLSEENHVEEALVEKTDDDVEPTATKHDKRRDKIKAARHEVPDEGDIQGIVTWKPDGGVMLYPPLQ